MNVHYSALHGVEFLTLKFNPKCLTVESSKDKIKAPCREEGDEAREEHNKNGVVPETNTKKGKEYHVGPTLLGFVVFVVIGSCCRIVLYEKVLLIAWGVDHCWAEARCFASYSQPNDFEETQSLEKTTRKNHV